MRLFRTIVAAMIAWSVAMAPVAGALAIPSPSGGPAAQHALAQFQRDISAPDQAPVRVATGHAHHAHHAKHDVGSSTGCCADEDGALPQTAPGDCSTMPRCVLKCFSLLPFFLANLAIPTTASTPVDWYALRAVSPDPPAPPFHPPRS